MKKVLVLGATGATGQVITNELIAKGFSTKVFGRDLSMLQKLWPSIDHSIGDVFNKDDIISAGNDVDTIFQCAAVPYNQTVKKQVKLGKSVMDAALSLYCRIIFIDGIYAFGDADGIVTEKSPLLPVSKKGIVKKELNDLIFDSKYKSLKPILLRLPDYYGPTMRESSYLGPTVLNIAQRQFAMYVGPKKLQREYVYLPDAAKMAVTIASASNTGNQSWNIPGQIISGTLFIKIAKRLAHDHLPVITLNKNIIKIIGPWQPNVAEISEMYYLTQRPIYLSHTKYEKRFGPIPDTPFEQGLRTTITALQKG
ncbi:NAD-dependent epimerase/dehydratase family protein [Pediococcus claussenii]|uniref:NAD dependent epimerase/dehydratase family protein n=1 Tax=Pediococcus claussenii (strain ATCC BAA-344 / DSM 14800 / JCM 18046 / KCTC 3811 / LMG 21948 / P06) TaxID=701521 RepID=G8PEF0_PEDCP|nr:NAD-dependent epimerase/dehydratase family protein [Pediococcus claussenii]AEV94411.1 NAD dependent epimerase/dehydratase family protein [Pediococcus claussenii ATCC BAA-344]ANZ69632.1 hypothetical protein AYR57_04580 [Pediococcus claussenii]ANZ71449.1 hypothetical protein AYR58_04585 [Pediococcus claussenii]KRN19885.1 hypothetical protein IV79_GL001174 [Pediococcus claussenii]